MIRNLSLTAALAAAMALPAMAQIPPRETPIEPTITRPAANSHKLTAEQAKTWIGKAVYGSDLKKVGEVVAFTRGADDSVTEMHAGIGGFLGIGETNVRVLPAQFRLESDRVVLTLTSAEAKGLPKVVK